MEIHFTEGLIVLIPLPDFSMPFNVLALAFTAITLYFSTIYRFTTSNSEDGKQKPGGNTLVKLLNLLPKWKLTPIKESEHAD